MNKSQTQSVSKKDIVGMEGHYKISSLGVIYGLRYPGCHPNKKEGVMKPGLTSNGYLNIALTNGVTKVVTSAHRLVAMSFIPNPENKPYVNHINGIKTDNRLENLEWCTAKENMSHAIKNGLLKKHKNPDKRRRPIEMICQFCGLVLKRYPSIEHVREDGFLPEAIRACVNNRTKSSYKFKWRTQNENTISI